MHILDSVRRRCREVALGARSVTIDTSSLAGYAASLPPDEMALPKMDPAIHYLHHDRDSVAYFLTLDAVNFGSGYFPDIFKNSRRSGYRAIAAALTRHFQRHGAIPPARLRLLEPADCARIFRLDPADPLALQLMELFAGALNELGTFLCDRFGGDVVRVVEKGGGSAERLTGILAEMNFFRDVARYGGEPVPFYKRAQLFAVDLFIAFGGDGFGRFRDLDRITICADNLVPHVLRLDGLLRYDTGLAGRIERGEPIPAGSGEEVEIRACAVHAGELIVARLRERGVRADAMLLDNFLWHRGQQPLYRSRPRHRTRTSAY